MSRTRLHARTAAIVALLMVATLIVGLALTPAATAGQRTARKLIRIVNETRERRDLRPLRMDRSLNRPARAHTREMIRRNRIYDPPDLRQILSDYRWDDLGADVVGCGNTLKKLHDALMGESYHRSILLHPRLRRAGIGVVVDDSANRCGRGSTWATEIFYG